MAYQRVRDVLDHVTDLHERLRGLAVRATDGTSDERSVILGEFIEEHEGRVRKAIAKAAPASDDLVLDTWLQFAPNEQVEKEIEALRREVDSHPDMDPHVLVSRLVQVQSSIVRLYEILEAESNAPRVREFFASLKELEDEAGKRVVRAWQESLEA